MAPSQPKRFEQLGAVIVVISCFALSGFAAYHNFQKTGLAGSDWYIPLTLLFLGYFLGGLQKFNRLTVAIIAEAALGLSAFLLWANTPDIIWWAPLSLGVLAIFLF